MKRFFRRVRRVIDFLPIIWEGEDYDYCYSIELFKYQLNRTADYIEERNFIESAKDVASEIRTATTLLENVYEEKYIQQEPDLEEGFLKHIKAERIVWKFIGHNIKKWWD